jgi:dihydrofolate reductase
MGAIHVHEFMSLDGVVDAPTWTFDYGFDPRMGEVLGALTGRSRGILLGRITYEMFEPAWSTRTVEDDPGAPFFNDTMKYVVSGTLTDPTWRNSTVAGPYDAGTIRRLKDAVDGELYVTRGAGPRLFPEDVAPLEFSLAASESYENGVVYTAYRPQA